METRELRAALARDAFPRPELYVIGRRRSARVHEYRDFLERNRVPFRWVDVDRNPLVRYLGAASALRERKLPIVLFPDGSSIEAPPEHDDLAFARTKNEVAVRAGLHARPEAERYDVVVLGAGPAGLTAAVYAASEGLRTLVVERHAPGGQAGMSNRIENYPGFPRGISGRELAEASLHQARRFGAEILIGSQMLESWGEPDGSIGFDLADGSVVHGRALIGAMGSRYRRLDAEGVNELVGAGVYYGSSPSDLAFHANGNVYIVGGANSAGQAALHAAEHARSVTLLVRGASIETSMSRYLVDRCERDPRIAVRTSTRVVRVGGDGRLEQIVVRDAGTGEEEELRADALFILIGGEPTSSCASGWLRRDEHGFLLTGQDVTARGERERSWPLARDPYPLESSQPGIFFAGDVRHGSVKRVASAVGEGAMAVQLVHRYLGEIAAAA